MDHITLGDMIAKVPDGDDAYYVTRVRMDRDDNMSYLLRNHKYGLELGNWHTAAEMDTLGYIKLVPRIIRPVLDLDAVVGVRVQVEHLVLVLTCDQFNMVMHCKHSVWSTDLKVCWLLLGDNKYRKIRI